MARNENDLFNSYCYSDFLIATFDENENIKINKEAIIIEKLNCNLVCLNENFIKSDLQEGYRQYNELVEECDCSDIEYKCIGSNHRY
ncbi:hypothetical protein BCR32DRAFT_288096 [Anaeromyces robustus]|uniref:Uncharacterized protein n=1 Tax=Anaeromyces robustus TaxID=1754192 RepID=A0A1Y1VEB6_9FUNG|nr:hypothetical protein BCR32DRAFT_288096 [Anaeromyces robustus]|eukprot:ORX54157.1 hypothetical protein BCR32DRAFT_288096 [Anaeromyces robustus]